MSQTFDNVVASRPALGRLLRRVLYALEHTPLQAFGLSHFLVLEKVRNKTINAGFARALEL
ncbi:MAG: hypothetical protein CVU38_16135 [Chloroflexi bacterium HGW-Chloroflexi-1]|nr:MAG: hypothetical protein CVU38_16135 [Chloroflexi bacterium HGW-Chloroflexi-1]